MTENKICPLLSISEETFVVCQGDRCAWYVPGRFPEEVSRCVVQSLAQKVGQL